VAGLRTACARTRSIPGRARYFSSGKRSDHPAEGSFPGDKASSDEVKNERGYTSIPPCASMACAENCQIVA
jgi:hypothetical protein